MALTGLQIQKLLPKTNCKECGSNTCMAFAMKLAAKKADLSACPYASDDAKAVLGAASEPPVRTIDLGGNKEVRIGGETVLYRHEKTFANQTLLAINVNDTDSPDAAMRTLEAVRDYTLERVGETLTLDMVSVAQRGDSVDAFVGLARTAWDTVKRPLVLRSNNPEALACAAGAVKGSRSVLCAARADTVDSLKKAAAENGHALAVSGPDVDSIASLTATLKKEKFNDICIQFETHSLAGQFQTNSVARRAALADGVKSMGYPFIRFVDTDDILDATVLAVTEINKYGGICILPRFEPSLLAPLMTLRLNIYTDPQKPIQVEPKVYPIGEPDENSPVFVTTNFSLTYFIVSGEIENAGTSAWLVVPECEGMSVLTAWAAGKFSGTSIGKFVTESGTEDHVKSREIIIPGYVAQISGELEEALPGWKAVVGPQEAGDIESFVKARLS
ncbi:MAG: acetyl-CoA decarbonylase/synthase complex subunit gamma [Chitinivibrionales bacterium]|nr:acetyl-CoA decarbonylase/synthase complex subunit gamma [Chitinivibrionales bacterium]MBD3396925.1 acetyl-CoA decarbonylase/synthase complex subunit gamma [Chitinivibrionales bacterium]